jgi:hypothetical protein
MRSLLFWDVVQLEWQLLADVSGQNIGPIFKDQAVQEELLVLLVKDAHTHARTMTHPVSIPDQQQRSHKLHITCAHTVHTVPHTIPL